MIRHDLLSNNETCYINFSPTFRELKGPHNIRNGPMVGVSVCIWANMVYFSTANMRLITEITNMRLITEIIFGY